MARPSDAPYTEAAKPAGPAPTTATSNVFGARRPCRTPPRGQLRNRRIAQDVTAAHQHERGVTGVQPLLREQRAGRGVGVEVDPDVRQPIADRELAQPPSVGRRRGANDLQAGSLLEEPLPAPQHDLHDHVGQLLILRDHLLQPIHRNDQHRPWFPHDRGREHALSGQDG